MINRPKHVLVAPLDWGLGHATRCIPIIRLLIKRGCQVSIASSGNAKSLLQREFPDLKFYDLPTYGAVYSKYVPFMIYIFLQVPKFLVAIAKEREVVNRIVKANAVDLIISDNRYGCRVPGIRSVFICHQLNLIMPLGFGWVSPLVNYFNRRWISKYEECWIPDDHKISLSGKLSYPGLPNAKYIGLLSRFSKTNNNHLVYNLAIILSGPEPQRKIFEDLILSQLKGTEFKSIIVRGVLNGLDERKINGNVTFVNHLPGHQLQQVIEESEFVVCRSGYSSIMDLAALGKKAVLVPTPGQTEQEYLGELLMKKKIALCQKQNNFDLRKALSEIKNYAGFEGWSSQPNLLEEAIHNNLK